MENLPPGFTVLQVYAFDADKGENAQFKYVMEDPSKAFQIDEKTGWISVKDSSKLDREAQSKIQMKVTAVEKKPHANGSSSFTTVEINLLDANDNNPQVKERDISFHSFLVFLLSLFLIFLSVPLDYSVHLYLIHLISSLSLHSFYPSYISLLSCSSSLFQLLLLLLSMNEDTLMML